MTLLIKNKSQTALPDFEKFFKDNFHGACLVAFRYISDQSLVEDLVQESFIAIWEKRTNIISQEDFRKYLFVTVRNRAISYIRSIKFDPVTIESSLSEIPLHEDDNLYSEEELALRIASAIKKLPPKCREIFMLAYIEDYSYQKIADQLGISKNTVKTQMGIAYRTLRIELKELYWGFFILLERKKIRI